MNTLLLLTNQDLAPRLKELARARLGPQSVQVLLTLADLEKAAAADLSGTTLLSFGTGVIVPTGILQRFLSTPINIHPASPSYPGRDPHHFAAYDRAEQFGATAHFMSERVDEGDIIDVKLHMVEPHIHAAVDYFRIGEEAGFALFDKLIEQLAAGVSLTANPEWTWCGKKTRRLDFHTLCRISPTITADDLDRRLLATSFPGYDNLVAELHGRRFQMVPLDGKDPLECRDAQWKEFTEAGYRDLLKLAKDEGYRFARFGDAPEGNHVLWRHDVDYSVRQSLRLARIEAEEGARSTFFFCLHLPFYSMLERETRDQAREIIAIGHDAGLHFDASFYEELFPLSLEQLEQRIAQEREMLMEVLDCELTAVSFHDPNAGDMLSFEQDHLAGLVNTYGRRLREAYKYCSDSNGYWRHDTIGDTIKAGAERLQVLTHPAWWIAEALPPRWRIERVVMERARTTMADYDAHLKQSGRDNIDS